MHLARFIDDLPTAWIHRFIDVFEDGRVQKHPHARFVNARGECCLVGALAGARSSAEFARSDVASRFRGTAVEALSRGFEAGRITGQEFYEEALLALAARTPPAPALEVALV